MSQWSKSFKNGPEAVKELASALDQISQAIGSTLGPGGRPFGYDKLDPGGRLTSSFSKDGLTVLRALDFDKPEWQAVLQYCRQASSHSVVDSGDGSSSSIILANAVCQAVLNANEKYPQAFARRLEKDAKRATEAIRKEAIKTQEVIRQVALTSTNGDEELTDVVLDAVQNSSAFGTIAVQKNPTIKERYKIARQNGYSNCAGYDYNSVFALSADSASASNRNMEWSNTSVLMFNGHLMLPSQLEPIMRRWGEHSGNTGSNHLVIVAFDVSDDVCNTLLVFNRNNAKHGNNVFVVKPRLTAEPNSGIQIMRDIAAFAGISDEKIIDGGNLRSIDTSFFGFCENVSIGGRNTIFSGISKNHWVEERILQNKSIVDAARSDFDRDLAKIRNAELAEGLVTVYIGGGLLPELHERADRFDDAQKAVKACMMSGALPGCGASYIRAGMLAGVHPALQNAFRSVYENVLQNYGEDHNPEWNPSQGETICISEDGITNGLAIDLNVLDSCETVCSVIQNGVALGINIATIGAFLYRSQEQDDIAFTR